MERNPGEVLKELICQLGSQIKHIIIFNSHDSDWRELYLGWSLLDLIAIKLLPYSVQILKLWGNRRMKVDDIHRMIKLLKLDDHW